ncbi:E3 ubiquitin-protein ligase rnf146 [Condylostylus longicornis]|uniref:E3 ubiquitin-protein ligase rnf146 n=1 Tax=Condylostylus longicornis TaxID=2530218 RepID=UPI00244DF20A|nr:E3 ubiquitin-protein ligase rnf146 [Condylostylus longicornis]
MTNNSEEDMEQNKTIDLTVGDVECPVCLQTAVHPTKLPCGHIFCFLCLKGVVIISHRCALCRRETSKESIDNPQLVYGKGSVKNSKPLEDGYQWFYEGRNGWWQYDERTSNEIENAYKSNNKSCTIFVAGFIYIVDFDTMMQRRQNDPAKKRGVKRDLAVVPKKGVAGIRLEENLISKGNNSSNTVTNTGLANPPPPPPSSPPTITSAPSTSSILQLLPRTFSFSGIIDLTRNRNNGSINTQPGTSNVNSIRNFNFVNAATTTTTPTTPTDQNVSTISLNTSSDDQNDIDFDSEAAQSRTVSNYIEQLRLIQRNVHQITDDSDSDHV